MLNTDTDNKFVEFLNNDNATFNYYKEMLDVHYDMVNEFDRLMAEWIAIVKESPDKLRLTGLLKPDGSNFDLVLIYLDKAVTDYIRGKNEFNLHVDIVRAFGYECKDKFHEILCGKAIHKVITEEIEKRSG